MWLEDTTSPSTSSRSTTRVSKRVSARSSSSSPAALWPKRKFSPTLTCSACSVPTRTSSMKLCALRAANSSSNGMTTNSWTPRSPMSSALRSSVVSRRGAPPGATIAAGCGSKVTTVSAPRMTSRWPRWTPSKVPTAIRRGRGCTSESGVTFIRGTLRRASAGRPRGAPRWPPARRRRPAGRARPRPRRRCRLAVAGAPRGVGVDLDARQEGERLLERQDALRIGVRDVERPDARAPQLLAVAVAQLGDERAHVGPGRALDEELRRGPPRATAARSGRR